MTIIFTRKIFIIILILVFTTVIFIWARSSSEVEHGSKKLDTLIIGIGRDFYDGPDSRTYLHGSTNTWESLVYLDENLRAMPWLAESWESQDGYRTWIFYLRKGILFHDGTIMTAPDVVANLERMRRYSRLDLTGIFRNVSSVEAMGENKVIIHLKAASPAFPNHLAYYSSPVLKPSGFDEEGRIKYFSATGPFCLEKVQKGQAIELSSFANYWQDKPAFKKVVFKTILDAKARAMALAAGEIDAIADVGGILPEQADEIRALPNVILKIQEVATTHYLLFNAKRPLFSDSNSRLWVSGLIDRNLLVQSLVGKAGKIANDPYSPLASDWASGCLDFKAGQKPKLFDYDIVILLNSGSIQRWPYLEIAQVIQAKFQIEGFNSRIEVKEMGAWQQTLKSDSWDLALQPNTLMTGDPDFFFSYYLMSNGTNNFGYKKLEMDHLISEARTEGNLHRRQMLYRKICEKINHDLPILPLYHDISLYSHRDHLAYFEMDQNFRVRLDLARPKEIR